jgi:predicted nucleotidyltransferase
MHGDQETRLTIGRMVQRIVDRFQPVRIVLFGSHARGDAGPDSDVDLLIVMPLLGSRLRTAVEIRKTLAGCGLAKDVVVMTPEEFARRKEIPGTLAYPAAREGVVLHAA